MKTYNGSMYYANVALVTSERDLFRVIVGGLFAGWRFAGGPFAGGPFAAHRCILYTVHDMIYTLTTQCTNARWHGDYETLSWRPDAVQQTTMYK